MFLIVGVILGVICALLAHSKGRNAIGWFFIGFLLGIIGLIICLVVPNLKEQRQKEQHMEMEQRRLQEQLRQERIKNERFQKYAQTRLDVHDEHLNIDTKHQLPDLVDPTAMLLNMQNKEAAEVEVVPSPISEPLNAQDSRDAHQQAEPQASAMQHGWYYALSGKQVGPVSIDQVKQYVKDGIIEPSTYVWHHSLVDWLPANQAGVID